MAYVSLPPVSRRVLGLGDDERPGPPDAHPIRLGVGRHNQRQNKGGG